MEVKESSYRNLQQQSASIPPAYKPTDVGLIPLDWDVKLLADIFSFSGGLSASRAQLGPNGYCYLHYGDIHTSSKPYIDVDTQCVDLPKLNIPLSKVNRKSILLDGDVVFVDASEDDEGASKHQVIRNPNSIPFIAGLHTIVGKSKSDDLVNDYKCYCFQTQSVKKQFLFYSVGTKVTGISKSNIGKIFLPIPKPAEQAAIARALLDTDTLIESLEQIIAKKRLIKQGSMQELLTGKRRLSGFSGNWVEKQLGNTAILKARIGWQGLTTAEYRDVGDYYLVTGTDFKNGYIDWSNCHYVDESRYKQDRYIQLKVDDVLVTKDGTIGKAALINTLPKPATLNSGIFVIRPVGDTFHPMFFYYILCSRVFTEFLTQLSAGSTINHLYQKDFVGFIYSTPVTIEEQAAIASILSDMDAEIAMLEEKLVKARQIKQGMMQELLTGRIRLV